MSDLFYQTIGTGSHEEIREVEAVRISEYYRRKLRKHINELDRRKREVTSLYCPLPVSVRFHKSNAPERLLRGSNRAGKTLTAAMEIAMIVSRRHPWIDYPDTGRIIAVGNSEKHIGTVMWDKLNSPQPNLRRIKDEKTGEWRPYFPWEDSHRFEESKSMGKLIPDRLIEKIYWEKSGLGIPAKVTLKTGWEILWYTGKGKPPSGIDIDFCWLDEEITMRSWYVEMAARLLDRHGRFLWSATAQEGGDQLWNLHLRGIEEQGKAEPLVEEFELLLADNPYIDEKEKLQLAEKYKHDPDAYRVRILGEYLAPSFSMYPTFSKTVHVCDPFDPPPDWCRYAIIDPSHRVCAVLFIAVPPPKPGEGAKPVDEDNPVDPWEDGRHFFVYDELYLRNCDTERFGHEFRHKTVGHTFQAFIIDDNGSRRTEMTSGTTIRQQFTEELRKQKVSSKATGPGFILGNSNVRAGLNAVRKWLAPADGCKCSQCKKSTQPRLRVMAGRAPNFVHEIERYHKKRVQGRIVDEPDNSGDSHLMDCARYAALHGCRYVKPAKGPRSGVRRYLNKKNKRRKKKPSTTILLGAGT